MSLPVAPPSAARGSSPSPPLEERAGERRPFPSSLDGFVGWVSYGDGQRRVEVGDLEALHVSLPLSALAGPDGAFPEFVWIVSTSPKVRKLSALSR